MRLFRASINRNRVHAKGKLDSSPISRRFHRTSRTNDLGENFRLVPQMHFCHSRMPSPGPPLHGAVVMA